MTQKFVVEDVSPDQIPKTTNCGDFVKISKYEVRKSVRYEAKNDRKSDDMREIGCIF